MNARPMFTVQEIQSSGGTHRGQSNPPPGNTMILRSSLQGHPGNQGFNTNKNSGGLTQKALFDYKKTLVNDKSNNLTIEQRLNAQDDLLDETRSVKSEFDYSVKKKFVEMISQQRHNGLNNKFRLPDSDALKKLDDDRLSKRSHLSLRSQRLAATGYKR